MSLKQKCPICSKDICDCPWHCTCNPNEIISFFFRKRMEQIKNQQYIDPIDVNNIIPLEYVYAIEIFRFWNHNPNKRKTNSIPKINGKLDVNKEIKNIKKDIEVKVLTPRSSIRKTIR